MIEGLNAIIKKEINVCTGKVELFYRLINISNHMLNITCSDSGAIHSDHLNALEEHFFLKIRRTIFRLTQMPKQL